mgnify:CR=1 FL=1
MRLYLKDAFTAGNCLAGFACALLAMRGELMWAALMMPLAMFFDAFDGIVARVTKRFNTFGAEFDNVADHMSYGVAPGFVLFAAYEPVFRDEVGLHPLVAAGLAFLVGSVPLFFASVRFARFNTYHYKTPGYWLGVPRPATGFALAALVNSHLFTLGTEVRLGCLVLVVMFGMLNASTFPYLNHHSAGKTPRLIWFYYFVFAGSTCLMILLGPMLGLIPSTFIGDAILFSMGCYSLLGWMEVPMSARIMARKAVYEAETQEAGNTAPLTRYTPEDFNKPLPSQQEPENKTLAGFSYLLPPLTGLFFVGSRSERDLFLRFHAWQSVFSFIGVCVAYLGVWILHGVLAALLPNANLLLWVGAPMGVAFVGIWLWMMLTAFKGGRAHGPFIGLQAEKQVQ